MDKKIIADKSRVENLKNNVYKSEVPTSSSNSTKRINNGISGPFVTYFDSPLGLLEIQSDSGEIISLHYVEEKGYREKLEPVLVEARKQLEDYFSGKLRKFDLPIKIEGTAFQNRVWQELIKIPYGKTVSYKDVAVAIGNKNAYRAVGNANNKNNISIIIPCHRVVGINDKSGGYGGGVWRKEWLIEHEKNSL